MTIAARLGKLAGFKSAIQTIGGGTQTVLENPRRVRAPRRRPSSGRATAPQSYGQSPEDAKVPETLGTVLPKGRDINEGGLLVDGAELPQQGSEQDLPMRTIGTYTDPSGKKHKKQISRGYATHKLPDGRSAVRGYVFDDKGRGTAYQPRISEVGPGGKATTIPGRPRRQSSGREYSDLGSPAKPSTPAPEPAVEPNMRAIGKGEWAQPSWQGSSAKQVSTQVPGTQDPNITKPFGLAYGSPTSDIYTSPAAVGAGPRVPQSGTFRRGSGSLAGTAVTGRPAVTPSTPAPAATPIASSKVPTSAPMSTGTPSSSAPGAGTFTRKLPSLSRQLGSMAGSMQAPRTAVTTV